ncbi:MAG: NifU N-terminal domain-containing protein [Phycisphaerales bacterium]
MKARRTPTRSSASSIVRSRTSRRVFSRSAAAGDPLAEPFFKLGGIRNILMNGDWISVNKLDDTDWSTLKPRIRRVLRDLEADGDA